MTLRFLVNGEETAVEDGEVSALKVAALDKGGRFLALINDEYVNRLAWSFWNDAPGYFFVIPASSSGKYHWATGISGLFDHVLMGMQCAYELARTFGLSDIERDYAVAAVAGHDCLKYGIDYDARYFDMHPFLPRSYYSESKGIVPTDAWETTMCAIERHMGSFNGEWTSVGRLKPETPVEQVVHLADYISSRKDIRLATLEVLV